MAKNDDTAPAALSFWHDSIPDGPGARPVLGSRIQADVAIVGAGYTGLWTAYYLKKNMPSLDIVVLEAEMAGVRRSCRAWATGWTTRPGVNAAFGCND